MYKHSLTITEAEECEHAAYRQHPNKPEERLQACMYMVYNVYEKEMQGACMQGKLQINPTHTATSSEPCKMSGSMLFG